VGEFLQGAAAKFIYSGGQIYLDAGGDRSTSRLETMVSAP